MIWIKSGRIRSVRAAIFNTSRGSPVTPAKRKTSRWICFVIPLSEFNEAATNFFKVDILMGAIYFLKCLIVSGVQGWYDQIGQGQLILQVPPP